MSSPLDKLDPRVRQRISDTLVAESEARRRLKAARDGSSSPAVALPIPTPPPAPERAVAAAHDAARDNVAGKWGPQDSWQAPFTSELIMVTLPFGPSVNGAWSNVTINGKPRRILTREARRFKKQVAALCVAIKPLDGPLGMRLAVYRPRRIGDVSNRIKVTEDSLIGFAYHDDEQIEHIEADRFEDKSNPRIEVWVWKLSKGPKP